MKFRCNHVFVCTQQLFEWYVCKFAFFYFYFARRRNGLKVEKARNKPVYNVVGSNLDTALAG